MADRREGVMDFGGRAREGEEIDGKGGGGVSN